MALSPTPLYQLPDGSLKLFTADGMCAIDKHEKSKCPLHFGAKYDLFVKGSPQPILNGRLPLCLLEPVKENCDLRSAHVWFRTAFHWRQSLRHNLTVCREHYIVVLFKTLPADEQNPAWCPGVYLTDSRGYVVGSVCVGKESKHPFKCAGYYLPVFNGDELYHVICTVELSQYDKCFANGPDYINDELYFMLLEHKVPVHPHLVEGQRKRKIPQSGLNVKHMCAKIRNYGVYLFLYCDYKSIEVPSAYSQMMVWPETNRVFERALLAYLFDAERNDADNIQTLAALDPMIKIELKPENLFE